MRVLIVDDEPAIRRTTRVAVETAGHEAHEASGLVRAERALQSETFQAILLDLKLGDGDAMAFLPVIRGIQPAAAVVVVTAYARIADAVEAMRRGAYDFVPKPFTPVQVRSLLSRIADGLADVGSVAASDPVVVSRPALTVRSLPSPVPSACPVAVRALTPGLLTAAAAVPVACEAVRSGEAAGEGDDAPATLEEVEAAHIRRILTASRTLEEAASILGINPATLYRKRQGLGLLHPRSAFGLPC